MCNYFSENPFLGNILSGKTDHHISGRNYPNVKEYFKKKKVFQSGRNFVIDMSTEFFNSRIKKNKFEFPETECINFELNLKIKITNKTQNKNSRLII